MALCMSLLGCLFLAYALNNAHAHRGSVFRQLSAEDLRNRSLRQSPELLEVAARSGETVTVNITGPIQGAIVQENVKIILDCGPWFKSVSGQNLSEGIVSWFLYGFEDLNHQELSFGTPLVYLNPYRATITGEYNEIFTILRTVNVQGAEDASRGIYECGVCVGEGPLHTCHSANTTVAVAGRPPILDKGTGKGRYGMCVCAVLKCSSSFLQLL